MNQNQNPFAKQPPNPKVSIGSPVSDTPGAPKVTQGEILTPAAKHRMEVAEQVRSITERANVLGLSAVQYVSQINSGKMQGIVPLEYTKHLIQEGLLAENGKDVTEKGLSRGVQVATETIKSSPSDSALKDIPTLSTYTDVTVPETTQVTQAQHIQQTAPQQPAQFPQPQFQPVITPEETKVNVGIQFVVDSLVHPLWTKIDNLIKFEEIVDSLIQRNSHKLAENRLAILSALNHLTQEIEQGGEEYLEELWKRHKWRAMFLKNRRILGINDESSMEVRSRYESKLPTINSVIKSEKTQNPVKKGRPKKPSSK